MGRKRPTHRDLVSKARKLLEKDGFEQIEYDSGELKPLPEPARLRGRPGKDPSDYQDTYEHFRRARLFLHSRAWGDATERTIWELYADGVPYREIARQLGIYQRRVYDTIRRFRAVMDNGWDGSPNSRVRDGRGDRGGLGKLISELSQMDYELLLLVAPMFLKKGNRDGD